MSIVLPQISWTLFSYYSVESKCILKDEKVLLMKRYNFPRVDVGISMPEMDLIYLPCDIV